MEGHEDCDRETADRLQEVMRAFQQELVSSPLEGDPGHFPPAISEEDLTQFTPHGIYNGRLRSDSGPLPLSTLSDTSSQCTNTDMMDESMFVQSLSDGDGSSLHRRRLRRRSSPSRRSYECSDCGRRFPTPQSLGGHRNLHRTRGTRGRSGPLRPRNLSASSSASEKALSIYKGVRCREGDKWVTEIRPPRRTEKWWLGTFPSVEEAAQAYDVALAFFKSESELNFGFHPLYRRFPALPPPNLSPIKYAQRLRAMVKEISAQIIAERRQQYPYTQGSPVECSPSSVEHPTTFLDDTLPELPVTDQEWITFFNCC